MDDDLLPLDRGVQVRDDANLPVSGAFGKPQGLRRRSVLSPGAEGTLVQLLLRRRIDERPRGAGAVRTAWCNCDEVTRERVAPQLREPPSLLELADWRNGWINSIGAGKTIVEELLAPISSSVCR